jgi:pimeloyl-ACP methyl ester carboxylesterase
MLLDDEEVLRYLFHPSPEPYRFSPQGKPTLTQSNGAEIGGYFHECPGSDVLLIFFHGNGEIAADYDALASVYTDCGVSYWCVDYRGYGRSTGVPTFSEMLCDAEAILADVPHLEASCHREFERTMVMGRSVGSASAIHLASKYSTSLEGLVLDSPYADVGALIDRLGGPRVSLDDAPGFEDNLDKMRRCTLPTLIIHGADDQIIPVADAEALFEASPNTEKQMLRVEGAGHNNLLILGYPDYCRELKELVAVASGRSLSQ